MGRWSATAVGAAVAAVAAQITYPLVVGGALDVVTVAVVGLLALAAAAHACATRSVPWALGFVLITAGLGLAFEVVGTATGFPFGCYSYATERLGPSVAGVPLVVPLAWTGGFYPVWCAVGVVAKRWSRGPLFRIGLVAVTVTGWDLYLDPQMVAAGYWSWCSTVPGLPGLAPIPVTNYLGWLAVALVMATAVEVLTRRTRGGDLPSKAVAVPLALFLWTWLGSALAHTAFLDLGELRGSALYGLVGMGVTGVPLLVALAQEQRTTRDAQVTFPPRTGR